MSPATRSRVGLLLWAAFLAGAFVALWRVGSPLDPPASWHAQDLDAWLTGQEPGDLLAAVLRVLALAAIAYLGLVTALGLLARALRWRPAVRLTDRLMPGFLRRTLGAAVSAGLAAGIVLPFDLVHAVDPVPRSPGPAADPAPAWLRPDDPVPVSRLWPVSFGPAVPAGETVPEDDARRFPDRGATDPGATDPGATDPGASGATTDPDAASADGGAGPGAPAPDRTSPTTTPTPGDETPPPTTTERPRPLDPPAGERTGRVDPPRAALTPVAAPRPAAAPAERSPAVVRLVPVRTEPVTPARLVPVPGGRSGGLEPPPLPGIAPLPGVAPRATATTWVVRPGEHFWSIAEAVVAAHLGRPPTDGEVGRYWRRLVDANLDRLAFHGQPDLLYAGQTVVLPPAA